MDSLRLSSWRQLLTHARNIRSRPYEASQLVSVRAWASNCAKSTDVAGRRHDGRSAMGFEGLPPNDPVRGGRTQGQAPHGTQMTIRAGRQIDPKAGVSGREYIARRRALGISPPGAREG